MAPEIPQTRWAKTVDGLGVPSLRSARVLPLGQARSEFLNPSGLHPHVAALEQDDRRHQQHGRGSRQHDNAAWIHTLAERCRAAGVVKEREEAQRPGDGVHDREGVEQIHRHCHGGAASDAGVAMPAGGAHGVGHTTHRQSQQRQTQ